MGKSETYGVSEPLDSNGVTDFNVGVSVISYSDDVACTFVSTDTWHFTLERPVTEHDMEIGVAYSAVDDLE